MPLDIEVDHLTKRYGPTLAVDDLSFQVKRGELVGFLGPNGAGKTTTMRVLTAFLPATAGSARVAGHDVFTDSLAVRRRIGYVPEGMPLYPEMRVCEYLDFRARLKGVPRAGRRRRIDECAARCGVGDVRRKLIGSLSKGYRQRVGLAEALLNDPPVLILDEPTIGLDPNQIREVRRMIRELAGDHTVLLSTHILAEVEMICDRVLIIHRGRLAYNGPVAATDAPARLAVEVRGPGAEVKAALAAVEGVAEVAWDGAAPVGRHTITAARGADVREAVFRRLAASPWALREMRPDQETLEEIFVRITSREGQRHA